MLTKWWRLFCCCCCRWSLYTKPTKCNINNPLLLLEFLLIIFYCHITLCNNINGESFNGLIWSFYTECKPTKWWLNLMHSRSFKYLIDRIVALSLGYAIEWNIDRNNNNNKMLYVLISQVLFFIEYSRCVNFNYHLYIIRQEILNDNNLFGISLHSDS